jgi:protein-tyrosine phosphatase
MAEGILRDLAQQSKLKWEIDSAGTGTWHIGERPDARAIEVCSIRGIDIRGQRARQFHSKDFENFDLILTMDKSNHAHVMSMARSPEHKEKVRLIMSYAGSDSASVPDPYFDGSFEDVYELLSDVCARLVLTEGENVRE